MRAGIQWRMILAAMAGALALGVLGDSILGSLLGGGQAPSRTEPAAPDTPMRPERLVEAATPPGDAPPAPPEVPPAPGPDASVSAAETAAERERLRMIQERAAATETRLAERRTLASESPLTPGVDAAADIARRIREGLGMALEPEYPSAPLPATDGRATGPAGETTRLRPPPEDCCVLARGDTVPAVLVTPIDSDLPGLVRARVTEDVRDTDTGRYVLIPRGTRLTGVYGEGRSGSRRLQVAWTDLRMPDGRTLELERFGALGADGAAGVKGRRSMGFLTALGGALLVDIVGQAPRMLADSAPQPEDSLGRLLGMSTGNTVSRVAGDYLGRELARGPRFRVDAGTLVNVSVERDLVLPPAGEG